ncbi:MAG: sulfatase-like hydrolase/transferase, partial [Planctomycetaceae bacterium]|nr:sulfatase-like hydrolase/transferase [Planctomycetaceae bacterium]
QEAISVIQNHATENKKRQTPKPLLLYLAYPAPHTPWLPEKKFLGQSGASMYGDFMVMVDNTIGRVLKSLEENQLAENTLVIFSSDNGPTWYDEDVERFGHDSAGGLRGMKADAWEAGHRVPFIVRWPGKVNSGSVSDQTICFTDLLATFAAMTDQKLGPNDGPDSFNFLSVLRGTRSEDDPVRKSLAIQSGNGMRTVRLGSWKLIEGLGSGGFSKPNRIKPGPGDPLGQLYDLEHDPAESKNLYFEKPEMVKRLQSELEQIRQDGRSRP